MPNLPPPPTGKSPIPTGGAGGTKLAAGGQAISALRNLTGFVPQMQDEINALIDKIKAATSKDAQEQGPPVGAPGIPGAGQMDSGQNELSGGPGAM